MSTPVNGSPSAPADTRHEWLVSFYWPNTPHQTRRRVFHTREAAMAERDRLYSMMVDEDPWRPTVDLAVRIDVREVHPWQEVG